MKPMPIFRADVRRAGGGALKGVGKTTLAGGGKTGAGGRLAG